MTFELLPPERFDVRAGLFAAVAQLYEEEEDCREEGFNHRGHRGVGAVFFMCLQVPHYHNSRYHTECETWGHVVEQIILWAATVMGAGAPVNNIRANKLLYYLWNPLHASLLVEKPHRWSQKISLRLSDVGDNDYENNTCAINESLTTSPGYLTLDNKTFIAI